MTVSILGHFPDHGKTKAVILPALVMLAVEMVVVLVEVVRAKVAFLP